MVSGTYVLRGDDSHPIPCEGRNAVTPRRPQNACRTPAAKLNSIEGNALDLIGGHAPDRSFGTISDLSKNFSRCAAGVTYFTVSIARMISRTAASTARHGRKVEKKKKKKIVKPQPRIHEQNQLPPRKRRLEFAEVLYASHSMRRLHGCPLKDEHPGGNECKASVPPEELRAVGRRLDSG